MAVDFEIEIDMVDDVFRRVRAAGEFDMAHAHLVSEAVELQVDGSDHPLRVELDLRDVTFCDAAGIGALVRARHTATKEGAELVVRPSSSVRRVLRSARAEDAVRLVE